MWQFGDQEPQERIVDALFFAKDISLLRHGGKQCNPTVPILSFVRALVKEEWDKQFESREHRKISKFLCTGQKPKSALYWCRKVQVQGPNPPYKEHALLGTVRCTAYACLGDAGRNLSRALDYLASISAWDIGVDAYEVTYNAGMDELAKQEQKQLEKNKLKEELEKAKLKRVEAFEAYKKGATLSVWYAWGDKIKEMEKELEEISIPQVYFDVTRLEMASYRAMQEATEDLTDEYLSRISERLEQLLLQGPDWELSS